LTRDLLRIWNDLQHLTITVAGYTRVGSNFGLMDSKRRMPISARGVWRLVVAAIGVIAIVQELRKTPDERTWHGKVADVVPYDFRLPTVERVRSTYWNPEGPVVSAKAFGVGWAPNFGVLTRLFGQASEVPQSPADR